MSLFQNMVTGKSFESDVKAKDSPNAVFRPIPDL